MWLFRLTCSDFYVDVRMKEVRGVWLVSADTPDGPSLGWSRSPREALTMALEPFAGRVQELLDSLRILRTL